ncbi:hypothetical protein CURTO8I2_140038 [Curtobacterium sp. 8I-2]|nr:hypothetical protein CURTO8I2_140038 [Curtobacterium sp. 8I-2]
MAPILPCPAEAGLKRAAMVARGGREARGGTATRLLSGGGPDQGRAARLRGLRPAAGSPR